MSAPAQDESESLLKRDTGREASPKSKFRSYLVFACMAAMNVLAFMTYSTLAPFFPQEAAAKKPNGSADLEVGLIFGTLALVVFVVAPILGVRVATIGPKFLLCAGVFLLGGATFLFGFVSSIDDWTSFLVVCFLARAVQGIGSAAVETASWTIVGTEFPDKIGTVFGVLETFAGLGFMIGPALGGALYKADGFPLPFFFTGGLLLLCLPGFIYALPSSISPTLDEAYGPDRPTTWKVLKNIWLWMTLTTFFLSAACFGMIEATVASFLKNTFDMSPATIGLVLLLCCGVYILSAPIVGYCADRWGTKRIMIVGLFVSSVGGLFLGPSFLVTSFVPQKRLWLVLVSIGILGIGLSMAAVPSFSDMILSTQKLGFQKGIVLNGVISGISTSSYSLGGALGPSVGGLIVGKTDFSHASTIFSLALAAHGYLYLILALCFPSKIK